MAEEILFFDALFDVVPPQIFLKFMFFSRNIRKIGLVHPEGSALSQQEILDLPRNWR